MPRGVAIPELRQQLFSATEQVIAADGPGRLSGRAVTRAAGVATGLLYAHFADLDDFLAAYAVDRSFQIAAAAAGLPGRAGTGTVEGNLGDVLLAVPPVPLRVLAKLLIARPEIAGRVRAVLGEATAGVEALEAATAEYLAAEVRLRRLPATADPASLALALVGALHRLVLADTAEDDRRERFGRLVTAVIGGPARHGGTAERGPAPRGGTRAS